MIDVAIKYIVCNVQLTRLHEYASFGGGSSLNTEFGPDVVEGGIEPDPVPISKIDLVIELGSDISENGALPDGTTDTDTSIDTNVILGSDIIESGSLPDDTGGSQDTDMDISVEFGTDVTE